MKIQVQAISDKGLVRDNNEDAISISGAFLRDNAMQITIDVNENSYFYLLLADGMGGHEKGELASQITLDELKEQFSLHQISPDNFDNDMREAAKYINSKLNNAALAQEQQKPMGCTLTGVVWSYGDIYLVNAGDSRTYRFRNGMLRQLTIDQTERGLNNDPNASPKLLNCLGGGTDGLLVINNLKGKLIEDDIILICSDGLTDMLSDDEIETVLNEGLANGKMIDDLALQLKEKACEAGGYDNVSIILAKL